MARTRSISSIDSEIAKLQVELNKAQEKCDTLVFSGVKRTPSRPNRNTLSDFQEHRHAEKNIT